MPRLRAFNPQDLAITAWAFAPAGQKAPALLDTIAAETAPRLREFNPQALANTAWAFAVADHVRSRPPSSTATHLCSCVRRSAVVFLRA